VLYADVCTRAIRETNAHRELSGLAPLGPDLVGHIGELMMEKSHQLPLVSPGALHRQQLDQTRDIWVPPSSEATCFVCVRQKPQHCLPCGHWICQTCVRAFARPSPQDPWLFHIDDCILCGAPAHDLCIRVKSDTVTARVLSFDGGGTRGRALLGFLQNLEKEIALPYPVQQNFDVVYGTSSGMAAGRLRGGCFADDHRRLDRLCTLHQWLVCG
jgi:hypothetical protein